MFHINFFKHFFLLIFLCLFRLLSNQLYNNNNNNNSLFISMEMVSQVYTNTSKNLKIFDSVKGLPAYDPFLTFSYIDPLVHHYIYNILSVHLFHFLWILERSASLLFLSLANCSTTSFICLL